MILEWDTNIVDPDKNLMSTMAQLPFLLHPTANHTMTHRNMDRTRSMDPWLNVTQNYSGLTHYAMRLAHAHVKLL